jgi:hypothetical protein
VHAARLCASGRFGGRFGRPFGLRSVGNGWLPVGCCRSSVRCQGVEPIPGRRRRFSGSHCGFAAPPDVCTRSHRNVGAGPNGFPPAPAATCSGYGRSVSGLRRQRVRASAVAFLAAGGPGPILRGSGPWRREWPAGARFDCHCSPCFRRLHHLPPRGGSASGRCHSGRPRTGPDRTSFPPDHFPPTLDAERIGLHHGEG